MQWEAQMPEQVNTIGNCIKVQLRGEGGVRTASKRAALRVERGNLDKMGPADAKTGQRVIRDSFFFGVGGHR